MFRTRLARWQCIAALCSVACFLLPARATENLLDAARHDYRLTRSNHLAQVTNTVAAWKFARACFDLGEFATNDTQRAALAHEGIDAAKAGVALSPNDPAPHFYHALNLGQLARTKLWTALGLIKDMEKAFLASIKADEKFNRASAHRSLGMLYQQAPGWPASIGSRSKARRHLEKAIELAPEYPDNHLTYMEALAAWDDKDLLRAALAQYRKLLPEARQSFRGPEWEQSWQDWQTRLSNLESKI